MINAGTYCREYEANSVRADNKYKGKTLRITGVINSISSNLVLLQRTSPEYGFVDIIFKSTEIPKIANLELRQTVTFIGIGAGKSGSRPVVKDAVLVVK